MAPDKNKKRNEEVGNLDFHRLEKLQDEIPEKKSLRIHSVIFMD